MKPKAETEIGRVVVAWLAASGWDVYQEVQPHAYGAVADIVATRGPLVWIIECKAALGLGVLEQALAWKGLAHYLSVASPPWGVRPRRRRVFDLVFHESGIGWLGVKTGEPSYYLQPSVEEVVAPRLARTAIVTSWRHVLTEAHKTYAEAGSAGGGFLTAWRASCDRVAAWVGRNPGASMKDMMTELGRLHYATPASARSAMVRCIQRGEVRGVRCERDGRALRLYPNG